MKDRDMYYGSYGYSGFNPIPGIPNQMPGIAPNQVSSMNPNQMASIPTSTNYGTSQFSDINERLSRLERQVKRLDQRLTRLETPYANTSNINNNEPDNNMYMM